MRTQSPSTVRPVAVITSPGAMLPITVAPMAGHRRTLMYGRLGVTVTAPWA